MTNPFDPNYLTAASPTFGPLAWVFFILQVVGVVAGLYFVFIQKDRNALRQSLLRQMGIALLAVGGIGVLLGGLRLADVAVFNQRYWFYLLLLVEVGLAAYVAYYVRSVYPAQLARSQAYRGKGGARREPARSLPAHSSQNGATDPVPPRPVATTGRRESRRERKRKNR